jgi:hypothetical protein
MRELIRHDAVIYSHDYFKAMIDKVVSYLKPPAGKRAGAAPAPPREPDARREQVMLLEDMALALDPVLTEVSWHEATARGTGLVIQDHRGWRLPTLRQLAAIRRWKVFPATPCYWSGDEVGRTEARYLHFDDGHPGQGPKEHRRGMAAVFVTERDALPEKEDGVELAPWWR